MNRHLWLLRFDTFTVTLRGDQSIVGRSSYCSVALTHPSVSRVHAAVVRRDGHLEIRDLGSKNGTFVNGAGVGAAPKRLEVGDVLRFGDVTCVLEEGGPNSSRHTSTNRPPASPAELEDTTTLRFPAGKPGGRDG